MKNTSKVFKEKINVSDSKKFLNAKETTVKLKLMDKKMTKQKHISKPLFFMSPYGYYEAPYGKIVDIYNEGGCKSVGEYIENNNISSTEYNGAMKALFCDDSDNANELFEFMITHKKFKHTEVIDEFIWCCHSKFKLDLIWKVKELGIYKYDIESNQYRLSHYVNKILDHGSINALIKLLEYKPTLFNNVDFSYLFYKFNDSEYGTDKYEFLNYLFENEYTNKEIMDNFTNFVHCLTNNRSLSLNMKEDYFKKVLDLISKNVSKEKFEFLLEHLMTELVYLYSRVQSLYKFVEDDGEKYNYYYNVIDLIKYIKDLYGRKFEIKFNVYDSNNKKMCEKAENEKEDDYYYYENMLYDQMIFNGYEFLSTFVSIFYEDMLFNKKDLIRYINSKNDFLEREIYGGKLNYFGTANIIFFVEYTKILYKFFLNIHKIVEGVDQKELEYFEELQEKIDRNCQVVQRLYDKKIVLSVSEYMRTTRFRN
jgi:hypothetical protein